MAMEVEEGETSYVTSGGSGGSVSVSLHPLVIMNISDHFTRVRVQQQDEGRVPLGALSLENHIACFTSCTLHATLC
jgi:COP9 signalosome complex subunit 6